MAVASTGKRAIVEATRCATGMRGLFEEIVPLDACGRTDPAPDLFLEAVRRLGVSAEECTVIEDSDGGLEAARRVGMSVTDVRSIDIHEWPGASEG